MGDCEVLFVGRPMHACLVIEFKEFMRFLFSFPAKEQIMMLIFSLGMVTLLPTQLIFIRGRGDEVFLIRKTIINAESGWNTKKQQDD
jgi:hypothetical protein